VVADAAAAAQPDNQVQPVEAPDESATPAAGEGAVQAVSVDAGGPLDGSCAAGDGQQPDVKEPAAAQLSTAAAAAAGAQQGKVQLLVRGVQEVVEEAGSNKVQPSLYQTRVLPSDWSLTPWCGSSQLQQAAMATIPAAAALPSLQQLLGMDQTLLLQLQLKVLCSPTPTAILEACRSQRCEAMYVSSC